MNDQERLQYAVLMLEGLDKEDFCIEYLEAFYDADQRFLLKNFANQLVRLKNNMDMRMAVYRAATKPIIKP